MFFRNRLQRYFTRSRVSWWTSSILHSSFVSLMVLEVCSVVAVFPARTKPGYGKNTIHLAGGYIAPPESAQEIGDIAMATPVPKAPVKIEPPAEATKVAPSDAPTLPGDYVREQVENAIAGAQQRSTEQNQKDLAAAAQRLTEVSNEKNVDNLVGVLGKALGTEKRVNAPAKEPPPGDFDFGSAQIYDVRREAKDDGGWKYIVTLLDKDGRTDDATMEEEEGKTAYDTFQLIKSNPLLERVYRGLMMSLLDKLMKEGAGS